MFCALNGHELHVPVDEAVNQMLAVAAGEIDEEAMAVWLSGKLG
jgi:prophage maintenance system killer protein